MSATRAGAPSLLDRLRRRYVVPAAADEARELRNGSEALGLRCIGEVSDRQLVDVAGVVRSLTHPPVSSGRGGRGGGSQTADLYDGSGSVDIVWLGRRSVPGVRPGVRLRVRGRVAVQDGRRRIFNPRYDILP